MKMLKPKCYDSVPPCLCKSCQQYDVFMASCVPRTSGESTSGLAVVNAARSCYADAFARNVRRSRPRSRPRSRAVAPPVSSSPVAVCLSTVPACSSSAAVVPSSAPFGSRVRSSVAASSSPVVSSPVAVPTVVSRSSFVSAPSSVVVSRPVSSGSLACPVSVSPVRPSPVVVPPVKPGRPAGSGSTIASSVSSVPVATTPVWRRSGPRVQLFVPSRSVGFPFVPVVCLVLVVVPVLLSSPFGFVLSFLPVWR